VVYVFVEFVFVELATRELDSEPTELYNRLAFKGESRVLEYLATTAVKMWLIFFENLQH
jgi:hypothetical protein